MSKDNGGGRSPHQNRRGGQPKPKKVLDNLTKIWYNPLVSSKRRQAVKRSGFVPVGKPPTAKAYNL